MKKFIEQIKNVWNVSKEQFISIMYYFRCIMSKFTEYRTLEKYQKQLNKKNHKNYPFFIQFIQFFFILIKINLSLILLID